MCLLSLIGLLSGSRLPQGVMISDEPFVGDPPTFFSFSVVNVFVRFFTVPVVVRLCVERILLDHKMKKIEFLPNLWM